MIGEGVGGHRCMCVRPQLLFRSERRLHRNKQIWRRLERLGVVQVRGTRKETCANGAASRMVIVAVQRVNVVCTLAGLDTAVVLHTPHPQGRVSERALLAVSRSGGREAPEPHTASAHGTATTITTGATSGGGGAAGGGSSVGLVSRDRLSGAGTFIGSAASGGSVSSLLPVHPSGSGMSASGAAALPGGGVGILLGGGGADRSSVGRGSVASRASRSLGLPLAIDVEAAALAAGVGAGTSTGITAGNSPARLPVVEEGASAGQHTVGSASRRSADSVGRAAMGTLGVEVGPGDVRDVGVPLGRRGAFGV